MIKQGMVFEPITCCAETSKVNNIREEVKYKYSRINVGMPVFMGDMGTTGKAEHIRKSIILQG